MNEILHPFAMSSSSLFEDFIKLESYPNSSMGQLLISMIFSYEILDENMFFNPLTVLYVISLPSKFKLWILEHTPVKFEALA